MLSYSHTHCHSTDTSSVHATCGREGWEADGKKERGSASAGRK